MGTMKDARSKNHIQIDLPGSSATKLENLKRTPSHCGGLSSCQGSENDE